MIGSKDLPEHANVDSPPKMELHYIIIFRAELKISI